LLHGFFSLVFVIKDCLLQATRSFTSCKNKRQISAPEVISNVSYFDGFSSRAEFGTQNKADISAPSSPNASLN
jgi:hypothetical protein